jgi:RNA-splicing ligase RtcB
MGHLRRVYRKSLKGDEMFEINGKYTTAKVYADQLEESCISQITTMVNHPAFTEPVAIMPDAHAGAGAVVGFTMPLGDKVIPNVIGVDIGCGMLARNLGPDALKGMDLADLDTRIREAIPFGFSVHSTDSATPPDVFWEFANKRWSRFVVSYMVRVEGAIKHNYSDYNPGWFEDTLRRVGCPWGRGYAALGTLGGGNHFIEFDIDPKPGDIWLVIHSGSRKFGLQVAKYWQERAVKYHQGIRREKILDETERIKAQAPKSEIQSRLQYLKKQYPIPEKGLEWLEQTEDVLGYMQDMLFAQQYAQFNRELMRTAIVNIIGAPRRAPVGSEIYCVHNFIDPEDMTIRKGAIAARPKQPCLVPLNMRDGALLGVGKGNPQWNQSAPHGAGRVMSRSQAKRELSLEEFQRQMDGVWSSSVCRSTLDEAPGAYKPWEQIFETVGETMEIRAHLKPIMNLKDRGEKRR